MGELYKEVWRLLDEDALYPDWDHILAEHPYVTEDQIASCLLEGRYEPHDSIEDRFVAKYVSRQTGVLFIALFEVQEVERKRYVWVVTAFSPRG